MKFIGIRAHDLEQVAATGENIFLCEVVGVMEEPRNFVVTLGASNVAPLRWQVGKNFWRGSIGDKVLIRLPADKIIFLRG